MLACAVFHAPRDEPRKPSNSYGPNPRRLETRAGALAHRRNRQCLTSTALLLLRSQTLQWPDPVRGLEAAAESGITARSPRPPESQTATRTHWEKALPELPILQPAA